LISFIFFKGRGDDHKMDEISVLERKMRREGKQKGRQRKEE
jgi:hypothetical protein